MRRADCRRFAIWLLTALFCTVCSAVSADVRMPRIFSNKAVLQREMPVPVWGWAEPGEEVTVAIAGNEQTAKADARGKWIVKLPAMQAGGPHEMTVTGKNKIVLKDILVGEVWLCSGQSNMQMVVGGVNNAAKEMAEAKYPRIRQCRVPNKASGLPAEDARCWWAECSPTTVRGFSAAAYFFGRELHKSLGVPIGLVNSSWGGTRIEPWTPAAGFDTVPELQNFKKMVTYGNKQYAKKLAGALDGIEAWVKETRQALAEGRSVKPMPGPRHPFESRSAPTGLYNGMIHPIVPFAIRGAIWYQGEANRNDGMLYFHKMRALIGGWRKVWDQGEFPFYFVQIAPYKYGRGPHALAFLWEAQTAALSIPNTGMAVINDIGNLTNIHPKNKQDVGKRLALLALARTYGQADLVCSGPLYKSMSVEDGKIRVNFEHVGGGLVSRDGKALDWFEIAGSDKKFAKAKAEIDGDSVIVSSEEVGKPVAVRFAWSELAEPNLMNKEGLPASAFRTDKW